MKTENEIPLSPFLCPIRFRRLARPEFDEMSRLIMAQVFAAWGAFLDCHLYEEALIHFLGGEAMVRQRVPLTRAGYPLGTQLVTLLTDAVAFRITALAPDAREGYETHLRRFLALSPFTSLHWVNLHHHEGQLVTITR